jgi:hypothetical protein
LQHDVIILPQREQRAHRQGLQYAVRCRLAGAQPPQDRWAIVCVVHRESARIPRPEDLQLCGIKPNAIGAQAGTQWHERGGQGRDSATRSAVDGANGVAVDLNGTRRGQAYTPTTFLVTSSLNFKTRTRDRRQCGIRCLCHLPNESCGSHPGPEHPSWNRAGYQRPHRAGRRIRLRYHPRRAR